MIKVINTYSGSSAFLILAVAGIVSPGQVFIEQTFTITMYRWFVPVFAKIGNDVIFVYNILQTDHRYSQHFQQ